MKFLRVVQFDASDGSVFSKTAVSGEWVVSGSFAFANLTDRALQGKIRQEFANGFLGLGSFGRTTFAAVAEMSGIQNSNMREGLASHLEAVWHAPDRSAALKVANIEADFVEGLCEKKQINTVFSVQRRMSAGSIHEEFRVIDPSNPVGHTRIWDVVDDN